jgi:hypothetical protein
MPKKKLPPEPFAVEVTLTRLYVIQAPCAAQYDTKEALIDDWFMGEHGIRRYHASRDASAVGSSDSVQKVRIVPPEEMADNGSRYVCTTKQAAIAINSIMVKGMKKKKGVRRSKR